MHKHLKMENQKWKNHSKQLFQVSHNVKMKITQNKPRKKSPNQITNNQVSPNLRGDMNGFQTNNQEEIYKTWLTN